MTRLLANFRLGFRMLRSQPILSAMSVVMLGLGIGLTTMVFSVINATVIEPLPFEDSRDLVIVRSTRGVDRDNVAVRVHDFLDWREQQTSFEGLGGFVLSDYTVGAETVGAEVVDGAQVTANTFDLLGVTPLLGRTFSEEEDRKGGEDIVVIGYGLWQSALGGRPDVLGTTIRIDDTLATVIGVMGPGFAFPNVEELWRPIRVEPAEDDRVTGTLTAFGRLRDGVGLERAQADLAVIARQLALDFPETNSAVGARVMRFSEWVLDDEIISFLTTMLAAAFAVLLIACVNVANLLLARAASRTRDVAVRIAVGASRSQLVAQLLTEAVVLAALGALLGSGIGHIGIEWFERAVVSGTTTPFWLDFRIDWRVAAFVGLITGTCGILAGVLPALQASVTRVNDVLKDEARGSSSLRMSRMSRHLVVAEIALSFALLVTAGFMTESILEVRRFDSSVPEEEILIGNIALRSEYFPTERRSAFWRELLDSLDAEPDLASTAVTANYLPGVRSSSAYVVVEGEVAATDAAVPLEPWNRVSAGFFRMVSSRIEEGRDFTESDARAPVAPVIVNRSFQRDHFPNESPVGRQVRYRSVNDDRPWQTIVGVVGNIAVGNVEDGDVLSQPAVYEVLNAASPLARGWVLARTRGGNNHAGIIREALHAIDPSLAVSGLGTLEAALAEQMWHVQVLGTLFITFGLGGLFMSAAGLYAVMAFSVRRRTGEIGVRMTLGATGQDISRMFLLEGLRQLSLGLLIGLGLAILLSRSIRLALFHVEPTSPLMFVYVAAGMVAVGFVASYLPARRAARLDPVDAIRYE